MKDPFDNWDANVRFYALVASLPTREQVIGTMSDGSSIVTTVPMAVSR